MDINGLNGNKSEINGNNNKIYAKERITLNVCCWNVRTLLDLDSSNRPERRTALVTRELRRLNVDIAALSETRMSDEDQLTEVKSGFTLFWVGKPKGEKREGGVGFAIRTSLVQQVEQPTSINERIMKLRVPLTCGRYLSILSVYAPTLESSDEVTMSFYEALRTTIASIPKYEKLIILGDLNARVGRQHDIWNALGQYGIGNVNRNGRFLLELCSEFNLAIGNTFFRQKLKHKVTWIHPRSKHGHMIDFIITRKDDIGDACNIRVLRSAECNTDHKLVRGKFKLRIRKRIRMTGVKVPKRIDVAKLEHPEICKTVTDKLGDLSFDGTWENFRDQVYSSGEEILGLKQKQHKDWFDDNDADINELLDRKHYLHQALLNENPHNLPAAENDFKQHKAIVQRELRRMKNEWWSKISLQVQTASDAKDAKRLYGLLRQVFGPQSSSIAPLKSKDDTSLTKDPEGIMKRWKEHFTDLFFNPSVVDETVIDSLPQRDLLHRMDRIPSLDEVKSSIKQINSGKAPGLDGIPVELLKIGGENLASAVLRLIITSWGEVPIPQDWIDGILVSIYKGKGSKSVCDNYRGITLLEAVGKVLARLLLNRLMDDICPSVIPETQSGFRSGRGTTDMVFAARQFQEKCIEQQVPLYQVFVDLTKAFDTVNREALWKILGKLGCPPTFVHMLKQLHRNMKAYVTVNGSLSDEIAVDTGVKQGDIPAPTLFSIYFAVLLTYAFQGCEVGIYLRFRTTGKVFDLRRFNSKSKTFEILTRELLYADDADFVTHSEDDMQHIMDRFSAACISFGLTISLKKTKVMFTPAPGEPYTKPDIFVNNTRLDVVDTFVYLGSTLSRDGSLDSEINVRIQKASVAFGNLEKRVWSDRGISTKTKINVYQTCVVTTLLYSSETWTTYRRHLKWLERCHQKCLRRILNIKWQTLTPDTEVLSRADCLSIESQIVRSQMRWAGHVVRMPDKRLPKQLFYGELKLGKRPKHKPKKRYRDGIKNNLKALEINVSDWETLATNRPAWRNAVKKGCNTFEQERIKRAKVKRALRKGDTLDLPPNTKIWKCQTCERVLLSKAAYVNHTKSHARTQQQAANVAVLPPRPQDTTCVVCDKVCKTVPGLKKHMIVHKNVIPQTDPINPVTTLSFLCHICHKPCRSNAGLKSHLRKHGRQNETNTV